MLKTKQNKIVLFFGKVAVVLFLMVVFFGSTSFKNKALASSTIITDTFTDTPGTLLENHTGELGATYTQVLGAPGASIISGNNQLRPNITSTQHN